MSARPGVFACGATLACASLTFASLAAAEPPAPMEPLASAHALVEELRCGDALPALEPLIAPTEPAATRQPALFLTGYCLAVTGSSQAATERFRAAWELGLDATLPLEVEPRVQILVDAARNDLLRAQADARAAARAALVQTIALTLDDAQSNLHDVTGGERVAIVVQATDPKQAIASMRVEFRQGADPEYYALPVRRSRDGLWRGEIPGSYTRTPTGAVQIFWLVVASDAAGEPLTSLGSRKEPNAVFVAKGSEVAQLPARERLPHAQRLVFAGLGLPAAGAFAGVATVAGLVLLAAPLGLDGKPVGEAVLSVAYVFLPGLIGGAAIYACASVLLDGWQALVPAAIFTALTVGFAGVVAIQGALLVAPREFAGSIFPDYFFTASAAFGGGSLSGLALGATAFAMVALDAPTYE